MMLRPLVYEYELRTPDTTMHFYTYYQTIAQGDSINFVSTEYDQNFQVLQLRREECLEKGMKLRDLTYFGIDSMGKSVSMKATIEYGAVFPFEVTDSNGVFMNLIKYRDPKDSTRETTLTRNLRFLKNSNFNFKGQTIDAIAFEQREEQSERDVSKGGLQFFYTDAKVYAKNLGLVRSERRLSPTNFIEMRLVDTFPMAQLEQRFKEKMGL
ncbi:MAG: hypothetical protein HC817_06780 [Saprospiraceae bacterium]|nr:hypothetical protein [Saprospiraceae bacterium]